MIFIGIDDTDSLESRGTNKLAKSIAQSLADRFACRMIVRHQLLMDERVPFTSHNGAAAMVLEPRRAGTLAEHELTGLFEELKQLMLADFIPGSDPGLCLTTNVRPEVSDWGRRCQREIVTQAAARELGARCGVRLEGLGGTQGGIIGALAAIGLASTGHDGRLIRWNDQPDDLSGPTPVATLISRAIEVRQVESEYMTDGLTGLALMSRENAVSGLPGEVVTSGTVDVGKHARPSLRCGRAVLFVVRNASESVSLAEWLSLRVK